MELSVTERFLAEQAFDQYCESKASPNLVTKVKLQFILRQNTVTLFWDRPFPDDPKEWAAIPVAQVRYENEVGGWQLYWPDVRLPRWNLHPAGSAKSVQTLLDVIDEDENVFFDGHSPF